jgi:hypothetical protein
MKRSESRRFDSNDAAQADGDETRQRHEVSRRRLLRASLVGALVLGGIAVAVFRARGYRIPQGRKLLSLSGWQFVVVQHAARRITAADRQDDSSIPSADEVDVVGFVDAWVARVDARFRRDLGRFLAYLEHAAPLACGFGSRFSFLAPIEQDRVLSSIQSSHSDLLRAGFDGIRSLVFMGYYRDARTWRAVGYDGPWVGRPAGGWW